MTLNREVIRPSAAGCEVDQIMRVGAVIPGKGRFRFPSEALESLGSVVDFSEFSNSENRISFERAKQVLAVSS
jgi:hypothetical protein